MSRVRGGAAIRSRASTRCWRSVKRFLRGHAPDDGGVVLGGQALRGFAECAEGRPEHRIPAGTHALQGADERGVPVCGPSADDQPVLVQDPLGQLLLFRLVGLQLVHRVDLVQDGVVAVELDHRCWGVWERHHLRDLAWPTDDLGRDACRVRWLRGPGARRFPTRQPHRVLPSLQWAQDETAPKPSDWHARPPLGAIPGPQGVGPAGGGSGLAGVWAGQRRNHIRALDGSGHHLRLRWRVIMAP